MTSIIGSGRGSRSWFFASDIANTSGTFEHDPINAQRSCHHDLYHCDADLTGYCGTARASTRASALSQLGQSAFAAMSEVVTLLEASPDTDWTSVDLTALHEHLVDMDDVMLRAKVDTTRTDDGLELRVSANGRVREAVRRMVPAHADVLNALPGWHASSELYELGAVLRVSSTDPGQVARIQGLGFFGLLVTGAHHRVHHPAIARGQGHP